MEKKDIKIIKIISTNEVIINSGEINGIEKGDLFFILDDEKRLLVDPDTGDILDEFTSFKDEVVVQEVFQKYSICKKPNRQVPGALTNLIQTTAFSSIYQDREIEEDLNVSEYDIDNIFSPFNKNAIINVGDIVKKVETK